MNQNPRAFDSETPKEKFIYGASCAYELTKWIIVLIIVVILIHFFMATIAIVDGVSMEPNFHTGEYLVVDRFDYNFGSPARGDAVVLKFPGDPDHKKYIKRIIGLPGDWVKIEGGQVYLNGKLLNEPYIPSNIATTSDQNIDTIVQPNEYFIMGDNRPNSNDSRIWGTAGRRFLIGKAVFQIYPEFKKVGTGS